MVRDRWRLGGAGWSRRAVWASLAVLAGCRGAAPVTVPAQGRNPPPRSAALAALEAHCRRGEAAACGALARRLAAGQGGEASEQRVVALWRRACRGGLAEACQALGARLVEAAAAGSPDAAAAFATGCRLGSGVACRRAAQLHRRGSGVKPDLQLAARDSARGCALRDGVSCMQLARAEQWGRGLRRDLAGGKRHLERACALGLGAGCVALGRAVEKGWGGEADPAAAWDVYRRAVRLFERGCDAAKPAACAGLAGLLREGSGVERDEQRGLALHERACRARYAPACTAWLSRGRRLVLTGEQIFATDVLAESCGGGDAGACFMLGRIGELPRQQAGRPPLAYDAFERACQLGSGAGCNVVGVRTVPPDAAGRRALERACALGDAPGCHHLALARALPGAAHDSVSTLELLKRSCGWRFGPACTRLGRAVGSGAGVPVDVTHAAALFEQGCGYGDADGCLQLGRMLASGMRLPADPTRSKRLIERACRLEAPAACARLGRAALSGTAADRARGRELLANACERGWPSACGELIAHALLADARLPSPMVARVSRSSQRRCRGALAACYQRAAGGASRRVWGRWAGRPTYLVTDYPSCGPALERSCGDAVDLLSIRCRRSGHGCFGGAELLRQLAAVGLRADEGEAPALERRGLRVARAECAAGAAAVCVLAAEALAAGAGGPGGQRQSARYLKRACALDPKRCRR